MRKNIRTIIQPIMLLAFAALISPIPTMELMPKSIVWFNDRQRLLELVVLMLVLILSIFSDKTTDVKFLQATKLRIPCLLLTPLLSASILLAHTPRHAVTEVATFVALYYFALNIAHLFIVHRDLLIKRVIFVLWIGILCYLFSFYTGYLTASFFKTPIKWPQPFTGFTNVRSFNQYQLWSIGLIALPLLGLQLKKSFRYILSLAFAFWWSLLFYSASRGVLLAWLLGILATTIVYKRLALPFLRLQIIYAFTGYCFYYALFKIIPGTVDIDIVVSSVMRETTSDRLALWKQAVLLTEKYPVLGVGPMHYAWHNSTNAHPHNSILQLVSECGLPSSAILLGIASYGFRRWMIEFGPSKLPTKGGIDILLAISMFFTMVTNGAYSLVDGVIVSPISQVLMFMTIGLMIGQYQLVKPTVSIKSRVQATVAGITMLALIWSTYPEISNGLSGYKKGFSMQYTSVGPRFWRETK